MIKIILYLLILLPSTSLYAGYPTGQEVLIACTGASTDKTEALLSRIHCLGYIDGVMDAHGLISSANPSSKYYCIPPSGIDAGSVLDKVVSYIQKHDDARDMTGRLVIMKTMQDAYPCK